MIALMAVLGQAEPVDTKIPVPKVDWLAVGPEVALIGAALILVLMAALNRGRRDLSGVYLDVGLAGVAAAGLITIKLWLVVTDGAPYQTLSGMVAVDGFAVFARTIILAATALGLLVSQGFLRREQQVEGPEYHALLLLSASGMLLMTSANDLIVVFLALEILSIALYVLAAFDRSRLESGEAGLKYFVLGAFSSAVMLYGVAMVYGATGTTALSGIAGFLAANTLFSSSLLLAGIALILVGLGFKVAAVPVPHVDPRRLPGCADPGDRLHGRRGQGRGLRRPAAGVRQRVRRLLRRLAAADAGPGHRLAARRQRRRPRAAGRQADAGLLLDQPRRLRPHRRAGRHRAGRLVGAVLPADLHLHGRRHLRRRHRRRPDRATAATAWTTTGASAAGPRSWPGR